MCGWYGRIAGGSGDKWELGFEIGTGNFCCCFIALHVFGCWILQLHCLLVIQSGVFSLPLSWFLMALCCCSFSLCFHVFSCFRDDYWYWFSVNRRFKRSLFCVYQYGFFYYVFEEGSCMELGWSQDLCDKNSQRGLMIPIYDKLRLLIFVFFCRWRITGWQLSFDIFLRGMTKNSEPDGNEWTKTKKNDNFGTQKRSMRRCTSILWVHLSD